MSNGAMERIDMRRQLFIMGHFANKGGMMKLIPEDDLCPAVFKTV